MISTRRIEERNLHCTLEMIYCIFCFEIRETLFKAGQELLYRFERLSVCGGYLLWQKSLGGVHCLCGFYLTPLMVAVEQKRFATCCAN